jgi:hypothetical protein
MYHENKAFMNVQTIIPRGTFARPQCSNPMVQLGPPQIMEPPNLYDEHMIRTQLAQSLPCKSLDNTTRGDMRLGGTRQVKYFGVYPHQGNQRGDKPGLASFPQHPTNTPLIPKASNFYPNIPIHLGHN